MSNRTESACKGKNIHSKNKRAQYLTIAQLGCIQSIGPNCIILVSNTKCNPSNQKKKNCSLKALREHVHPAVKTLFPSSPTLKAPEGKQTKETAVHLFLTVNSKCWPTVISGHKTSFNRLKTHTIEAGLVRPCSVSSSTVWDSPWYSHSLHRRPAGPVCSELSRSSASTRMSPAHCCCTAPAEHR